jgi:SAM-dependent methyltransferase
MTTLDEAQKTWDTLATIDAPWAILTDPRYVNGRWPMDEFWATGEADVDRMMADLNAHGLPANQYGAGHVLDLGCGIGRLTRALVRKQYALRVTAVDLSAVMLKKLRQNLAQDILNGKVDPIQLRWTDAYKPNSRVFTDLDAWPVLSVPAGTVNTAISLITLQHTRPQYSLALIGEVMLALKAGGLAWIQVPLPQLYGEPEQHLEGRMEMHGISPMDMIRYVRRCNGQVLDFRYDPGQSQFNPAWVSTVYILRKN